MNKGVITWTETETDTQTEAFNVGYIGYLLIIIFERMKG